VPKDAVVSAILEDLLDPEGAGGLDAALLRDATAAMQGRISGMPTYMGLGIRMLTRVFTADGYSKLPKARRIARIEAWRNAPLSPMRDWVEFYEKMGTFVYYTQVERSHHSPGTR
jgi:hypothetical protein